MSELVSNIALLKQKTRALVPSSGLTLKDIGRMTLGAAPDAFDGIRMRGELVGWSWCKPYF